MANENTLTRRDLLKNAVIAALCVPVVFGLDSCSSAKEGETKEFYNNTYWEITRVRNTADSDFYEGEKREINLRDNGEMLINGVDDGFRWTFGKGTILSDTDVLIFDMKTVNYEGTSIFYKDNKLSRILMQCRDTSGPFMIEIEPLQ